MSILIKSVYLDPVLDDLKIFELVFTATPLVPRGMPEKILELRKWAHYYVTYGSNDVRELFDMALWVRANFTGKWTSFHGIWIESGDDLLLLKLRWM